MKTYRPHDLLLIGDADQQQGGAFNTPLPAWAKLHWPVVVRRAPSSTDGVWLPVGVRGTVRHERFPAMLRHSAVQGCITPKSLLTGCAWQQHPQFDHFAAVIALSKIARILSELNLPCGPTGSVGFALASGVSILRADSDLDLLVRASESLSKPATELLHHIQQEAQSHQCRIDIQIDTGFGGFAFDEWARHPKKVLLKTDAGPILTDAPWSTSMKSIV